jgi:Bacterial Ig domain
MALGRAFLLLVGMSALVAQAQPSLLGIGVTNQSHIVLQIQGDSGDSCVIRASTNLADWSRIGDLSFPIASVRLFEDVDSGSYRYRYYRIESAAGTASIVVVLVSPANGTYPFGLPILLQSSVTDSGGTAAGISYWMNGAKVFSSSYWPSAWSWTPTNSGSQTCWAVVNDKSGGLSQSAIVTFMVDTNHPPAFSGPITAMEASTGSVMFGAPLADYENRPARVDYYVDDMLFGVGRPDAFSLVWRGAPGTHTVKGKGFDVFGLSCWSDQTSFVCHSNVTPLVTITNPITGTFLSQAATTIGVVISTNISVSRVVVYAGTNSVVYFSGAPYITSWKPSAEGTVTLTAMVTDSQGALYTNDPVYVQIDTNHPPTANLRLTDGLTVPFGTNMTIVVEAADDEHRLAQVALTDGGAYVGASYYQATNYFNWIANVAGSHQIYSSASDEQGLVTKTLPVQVTVAPPLPPTIQIASPVANQVLLNNHLKITPLVSSPYGIGRVVYYCDGIYIGSSTYNPFVFDWTIVTPLAQGPHQLTATAYDRYNQSAQSPPVTLQVPQAPSITFVYPIQGAQRPTPGIIHVAVAIASSAEITNLTFSADGGTLVTLTNGGLSFDWTNAPLGTHVLNALALDNVGLVDSSSISITVVPNQPPGIVWQTPSSGVYTYNQLMNWMTLPSDDFTSARDLTVSYLDNGVLIATYGYQERFIMLNYIPPAGNHVIRAVATDDGGATNFADLSITVLSNRAPSIVAASPVNGSITIPGLVPLTATAVDLDGDPVSVVFYMDDSPVTTNASPYMQTNFVASVLMTNIGNHTWWASANSAGFVVNSSTNLLLVDHQPTFASFGFGGHSSYFAAAEDISVSISGIGDSDNGDYVAKVSFYVDGVLSSSVSRPGVELTQTVLTHPLFAGSHSIYAVLTDKYGGIGPTATLSASVGVYPPVVAFLTPTNGSSMVSGTSLNVSVNASGYGITQLVFYANGVAISTNATTNWTWQVPSVGAYQLAVVAVDSQGLRATNTAAITATSGWGPVVWSVLTNASITSVTNVSKMGGDLTNWVSFAYSSTSLTNNGGIACVTGPLDVSSRLVMGLTSTSNLGTSMAYSMVIGSDSSSYYIFENGVAVSATLPLVHGDAFRILVTGGQVRYYRINNGTASLVYTSNASAAGKVLHPLISLKFQGAVCYGPSFLY